MMTVKCVIRLWPENRVIICIEAIGTHHYFAVSSWRFGDEGLIWSCHKIFSVEQESPYFAICQTDVL